MTEGIIVAIVMAAGTIGAQLVIARENKKATTAIINHRVGELEKKVDKHNQLYDRTVVLETEMKEVKCDITEIKRRVERVV